MEPDDCEEFNNKKFFKITNEEECHYGFQYKTGLNTLIEPFTDVGHCVPGGLYFTDNFNILRFLDHGIYLRQVLLPVDDIDLKTVADGNNKWRSNKIILGTRYDLDNVDTYKYLESVGTSIELYYGNILAKMFEMNNVAQMDEMIKLYGNIILNDCVIERLIEKTNCQNGQNVYDTHNSKLINCLIGLKIEISIDTLRKLFFYAFIVMGDFNLCINICEKYSTNGCVSSGNRHEKCIELFKNDNMREKILNFITNWNIINGLRKNA